MVGALNLISVAFAVLFVGLGVDFGIQFSVRYRAERFTSATILSRRWRSTASKVGAPLTLAAAAIAAGFLSFLPTDYRGVSELGQIAGIGMLIAYLTSITLLPALLTVLNPPGEPEPLGYRRARAGRPVPGTPSHRRSSPAPSWWRSAACRCSIISRSTSIRSICAARRSSRSRPFSTCGRDPTLGANAINVRAAELARRRRGRRSASQDLPEVDKVTTLDELHPGRTGPQARADPRSRAASSQPPLSRRTPRGRRPTPRTSPRSTGSADALKKLAGKASGAGADAANVWPRALTQARARRRTCASARRTRFLVPLRTALDDLRTYLQAGPVTLQNLPDRLKRQWIAADGRARVAGPAEGRSQRQRNAAPLRARHPGAVSRTRSARRSRSWSPARRSCGRSSTPACLR